MSKLPCIPYFRHEQLCLHYAARILSHCLICQCEKIFEHAVLQTGHEGFRLRRLQCKVPSSNHREEPIHLNSAGYGGEQGVLHSL